MCLYEVVGCTLLLLFATQGQLTLIDLDLYKAIRMKVHYPHVSMRYL